MFIIIEYIAGTYDNLNIMLEEDGSPVMYGSYHSAEQYAKDECAFDYKIVEL